MKNKFTVNVLLFMWAVCATRVAYAASFSQDMKAFDLESLIWGATAGLLAGVLRTIFTLASENVVVYSVLKEARKDLVVSFIVGGIAYFLMWAISSVYPNLITREVRLVVILAAGWTRVAFVNRLSQLVNSKLDRANDDLRAGAPISPPSSGVVPLGEK
ncbi:hypothetical protein [Variovorax sp. PAMC 28711]|uniref:hypothetical protein n=1 Tax=Variovorax sp. PAMC 28711 TaxID=1795631 RepID=UPI00078D8C07|nr:hypothetical protein [Variovorax sp. PAMC 28711]AMM23155.1 hypothetical protein AX767_01290 [Variovorax sp. PAMC 28711]